MRSVSAGRRPALEVFLDLAPATLEAKGREMLSLTISQSVRHPVVRF